MGKFPATQHGLDSCVDSKIGHYYTCKIKYSNANSMAYMGEVKSYGKKKL